MVVNKEHRRNKSSLGSTNTFIVNSVVKQFDNESDSDHSDSDVVNNNDFTANANDLSSVYIDNTKNDDYEDVSEIPMQNQNIIEKTNTNSKPSFNIDKISLPTNIFNFLQPNSQTLKESKEFHDIFSESCIIKLNDEIILQKFIAIVYNIEKKADSFCCFLIDKFGCTFHKNIDISKNSKYFEAIQNLPIEHQNLNVSKSVAAAVLQKYAFILKHHPEFVENQELLNPITAANTLINSELIETNEVVTPLQVCLKIQQFSLLNDRQLFSNFIDVVYNTNLGLEKMEQNNHLVFFLGEQLEQLFNPLTEYSPEEMEQTYKPTSDTVKVEEAPIIQTIIKEFISVQTYLTIDLVRFLTKFIIPIRIAITKQQIPGLTNAKFNEVFPPTIDEVTRVNCIFLDALKISSEYGLKECMKSMNQTISYFYKAYTRHEAATKNCFKKVELFFKQYPGIQKYVDLDKYTVLKIDTVINAPQEKLFKIKLILDRLVKENTKNSSGNIDEDVKAQYDHIVDVINQFGTSEDLQHNNTEKNYQQRILTPSGKLLTEIATNWPVELQYKWLKRKVVGTFDCINQYTGLKNCVVIFSDYIVCLEVLEDNQTLNNPLISDVLMHSLINEKPLPSSIPSLKVTNYSAVSKTLITAYGGKGQLRIDILNDDQALYMQLVNPTDSVEYICELLTKACILCKSSAFHLFKESYEIKKKNEHTKFNCYVTAHDLLNYEKEKIKSPFTIFLNIKPTLELLKDNSIFYGFFVNNLNSTDVEITILSLSKTFKTEIVVSKISEYNHVIMKKMTDSIFIDYYYSLNSPLLDKILSINANIVDQIEKPLIKLKESVVLSSGDLKRFSTLMNPQSPLLDFASPQSYRNVQLPTKNVETEDINKESIEEKKTISQISDTLKPEGNLEKKEAVTMVPVTNLQTKKLTTSKEEKTVINQKVAPKAAETNKSKDKQNRKKNRLSGFFSNIFGGSSKSKMESKKSSGPKTSNSNHKILEPNYKHKPVATKSNVLNKPNELNIKSLSSVNKKEYVSSPSKKSISSPVKIQRESYKEDDLPKLNSNLDTKLFNNSKGSVLTSATVTTKKEGLTIDTKSPFVNDEELYSDTADSSGLDTEIGQAYMSPISNSHESKFRMITPEKVEVFEKKPSIFDVNEFHTPNNNDKLEDIDDMIIEQDGNTKRVRISQSPSFRELFLKLETDIKPLNIRSSPNYWSSTSLNASGLTNEKDTKPGSKAYLGSIYETVIEEDEEDEIKDNSSFDEENNDQLKKSLVINTKVDHVTEIPKHSPLEAHFPTSATSSKSKGKWAQNEKYGNKFKVVRYENAANPSPQKSDYLKSPSKTPLMKNNNDDITDDIKTMTLDGVNLDFVSPVKTNNEALETTKPGNRIVSDLKIDFSNIGLGNDNLSQQDSLKPSSPLMAVFNQSPYETNVQNDRSKDPVIKPKTKKFDIRSESFGYLSDFI
ncbi:hypothetical protein FOG51_00802 [Hanseniaspora uvarum]|nr:hypothetical protein FOG51_00802 [Hanseniaspora uvarum]